MALTDPKCSSSSGLIYGDEFFCLIHSHVTVMIYQLHSDFDLKGYLHAQKYLGKLIYILASSMVEKILE